MMRTYSLDLRERVAACDQGGGPCAATAWDQAKTKIAPRRGAKSARVGSKLRDLPADSPGLNPIETTFIKTTEFLRSVAAREIDEPVRAIDDALEERTPPPARFAWEEPRGVHLRELRQRDSTAADAEGVAGHEARLVAE